MARPYQIRSRYGQNEPTGPERFSSALTSGLDAIAAESEARRAEENEFRRQGGVQVGKAPSAGDRFNAVKQRVGRVFGRGGPPAIAVDETLPDLRVTPSARPQAQVTFRNATMQLPTQMKRPVSPIASALDDDLSYEMKSRSGKTFKFDPLRAARAEASIKGGLADREHRNRMEEVTAENASREKVAGIAANQRQQTAQYTYAERRIIAERANESRIKAAQIAASGRANTDEGRAIIQQAVLDLREAALAMQQAGLEATGYENAAKALEAKIPTGTDRIVDESQPGGRERIANTEAEAARLRQEAMNARRRGASGRANPPSKPRISQQEYDLARATHPDSTIAKSYDLTGIKRKP